jgi:hypothetical protein
MLCTLAIAPATWAQTTVPHTFAAGSPAKAGEVNANFQALAAAINSLAARLDRAEGKLTAADIVGTYRFQGLQTEQGGPGPYVRVDTTDGVVTFRSDGTGSLQLSNVASQLSITGGQGTTVTGTRTLRSFNESDNFNWSITGSVIDLSGLKFYAVDGGRLLVQTSTDTADGTGKVILLVRTN